jgi:hypothetical protein
MIKGVAFILRTRRLQGRCHRGDDRTAALDPQVMIWRLGGCRGRLAWEVRNSTGILRVSSSQDQLTRKSVGVFGSRVTPVNGCWCWLELMLQADHFGPWELGCGLWLVRPECPVHEAR